MPIYLLNDKLIVSLNQMVTSSLHELLVTTKHIDRGLQCLNTIMLSLVSVLFVTSQSVAPFALNDSFTYRELVGRQKDSWHDAATMGARDLEKETHLLVLFELIQRVGNELTLAVHLAFVFLLCNIG